jgi:hypothetical protein
LLPLDDRLHWVDFRALSGTADLKASRADSAIDETIARLSPAVDRIALPKPPGSVREAGSMAEKMSALIRSRLASFA